MKILAIGDPHGEIEKVKRILIKGVDLILLTGDLGKATLARKRAFENVERKNKGLPELEDTQAFDKKMQDEIYFSSIPILKYCTKIAPTFLIYGNIEPCWGERPAKNRKTPWLPHTAKKLGVRTINNVLANFHGIRIGGLEYFIDTSWVREFKPRNYKEKMERAKKQTDKVKRILKRFGQVDILIHHQPPFGILDKVGPPAPKAWRGKRAGSKAILNYIKKEQPRYTFCGHIHEGEGHKKVGKTHVYNLGVAGHKIIEL